MALLRWPLLQGQVIVIRYEGPKGGPGMPEMLTPTSAIMGAGLGEPLALLPPSKLLPQDVRCRQSVARSRLQQVYQQFCWHRLLRL